MKHRQNPSDSSDGGVQELARLISEGNGLTNLVDDTPSPVNGSPLFSLVVDSETGSELHGTAGSNFIFGLAGNDSIDAAGGNDFVAAGEGDDEVVLGQGTNMYYGDNSDGSGSGADAFVATADTSGLHIIADYSGGTGEGAEGDTLRFESLTEEQFNALSVTNTDAGAVISGDMNGDADGGDATILLADVTIDGGTDGLTAADIPGASFGGGEDGNIVLGQNPDFNIGTIFSSYAAGDDPETFEANVGLEGIVAISGFDPAEDQLQIGTGVTVTGVSEFEGSPFLGTGTLLALDTDGADGADAFVALAGLSSGTNPDFTSVADINASFDPDVITQEAAPVV